MLVPPRSFKYSTSPTREADIGDMFSEKSRARPTIKRRSASPISRKPIAQEEVVREQPSPQSTSEPVVIPSKPVAVPTRSSRAQSSSNARAMQTVRSRGQYGGTRRNASNADPRHRSDALPPAVAALLAVTAIPPPRKNQFRRRSSSTHNVSIDELVNSWKSEDAFTSSCSSSPTLSMLLEDSEELGLRSASAEDEYMHHRSASSDSVPSLEADDRSTHSGVSPSTPGSSFRSRKSGFYFPNQQKPTKAKSLPQIQDCADQHPLIRNPLDDDIEDGLLSLATAPTNPQTRRTQQPLKPRSTFRSNLTTSLQNLKSAAAKTFSLTPSQPISPQQKQPPHYTPAPAQSRYPDSHLWSHPYLFPHFSSEIRPQPSSTPPSQAQRHYLNPPPQNPQPPLSFEEQETPYQLALHAPGLHSSAAEEGEVRWVMMQTYTSRKNKNGGKRSKSGGGSTRSPPTAKSGYRQREVRENGDFLRVVVLEMNMRREGKLEEVGAAGGVCGGKARFWLPPREVIGGEEVGEVGKGVPRRWRGVSA